MFLAPRNAPATTAGDASVTKITKKKPGAERGRAFLSAAERLGRAGPSDQRAGGIAQQIARLHAQGGSAAMNELDRTVAVYDIAREAQTLRRHGAGVHG